MKTISVLISGGGSNLAAIIDAVNQGRIPARINAVIADRDCTGKQHAFAANLPFTLIDRHLPPAQFSQALLNAVPADSDFIVLAGFLSIIPPEFISRFPKKIINLHPSLLPEFGGAGMYGMNVHRAVLAAGKPFSGCTVHYVDSGIDTGEIIAQSGVPVLPDDTPETLQKRIQAQEHQLLTATIARLLTATAQQEQEQEAQDLQLAELLCRRLLCIYQAAQEKPSPETIRLPARIEEILHKVLPVADRYGIDRDYPDFLFRLLIDESIRREQRQWQLKHRYPSEQITPVGAFIPSAALTRIRADIDAIDQQLATLLCRRLLSALQTAATAPAGTDCLPAYPAGLQQALQIAEKYGIDSDYPDMFFRCLNDECNRRIRKQSFLSTPTRDAQMKTVLIIGAGGREHAIARKLAQDSRIGQIFVAPGNAGTATENKCRNVALNNIDELLGFAKDNRIDLTVVGAEALLAEGIVDRFQAEGLNIFGPDKHAAQLESSKRFAKDFMQKYGVKTADYRSFSDPEAARNHLADCDYPVVVKASGLAAGKGVIICQDRAQACAAVDDIMQARCFGEAGAEIVIETFLTGFECSVLSFCDSQQIVPLLSAGDHKTIGEHNTGANTGGMGVVSPHPRFTPAHAEAFTRDILNPTLTGIQAEQMDFAGVIFFGLMINEQGVYLLEYNMRMGDPETQAVLPLLDSALLDGIEAASERRLHNEVFLWRSGYTCCVVAASGGYPGEYRKGLPISGLAEAGQWTEVFIAGAELKDDTYYSAGGRVINLVGYGETLDQARQKAYAGIAQIRFTGMTYRRDIGASF